MNKIINGYKVIDGVFEMGSATTPSFRGINAPTYGIYFPTTTTVGFAHGGVNSLNVTYDSSSHAVTFKNPNFTQSLTDSAWVFDTVGTSTFGADLIFAIKMAGTSKLTLSATGVLGLGGSGGMSVGSGASSWPITGSGTNTTIQLTPSGTGSVRLGAAGLVIPTGSGFKFYNTADETTNTERIGMDWSSNIARIYTIPTGSGTARVLQISAFNSSAGGGSIQLSSTAQFVNLTHSTTTLSGNLTGYTGTSTNSSGTSNNFVIIPTVSGQSGTAGYNALYINPAAGGGGSGTKNLIYAALNSVERLSLGENGVFNLATGAVSGGVTGFTYTPGAHTAVTAMLVDFKVAAHTMTITGGFAGQIFSYFDSPTITAASGLTVDFATNVSIGMTNTTGSAVITTNTALVLGTPAGAVTLNNAAGTHYSLFETTTQSYTLGTTTQVTSACGFAAATFGGQTINQSGGAVTVDNVATVYISGALTAGASVTLTNNYALFSDAGLNRFDGNGTHVFELPADATDPTGGGGAAAGRIAVKIGGATKYIAYY